jgi:hypothetical protein
MELAVSIRQSQASPTGSTKIETEQALKNHTFLQLFFYNCVIE